MTGPAKSRFFVLAAIRLGGVAMTMVGVSILMKRWLEPSDIIGTALMVLGVVETIVVPIILVRAWATPKDR